MDWLNKIIKKNPFMALMMPTGVNVFTFIGNVIMALSDGEIDSIEFHQLMSSASGLEALVLIVIMLALKQKQK